MDTRHVLNIFANFAGAGCRLFFLLIFNIAYYRLLGSESYGLIGLSLSFTALASMLDFGFGYSTVREVARRATDDERAAELRTVVFTFGLVLCGCGAAIGLVIAILAPFFATHWIAVTSLSTGEVTISVALMGAILALMFPANVFHATLMGLQQQVLDNAFATAATAFRGAITIASLYLFERTPVTFFSVQLLAAMAEVFALGALTWQLLPSVPPGGLRFDIECLQESCKFSSATWLAALVVQCTTMADKIILSALLPLHVFGLYSLGVTTTTILQRLAIPFTNTYSPYFVALAERGSKTAISQAYHLATQLASAVFLSVGLLLAIWAEPIARILATEPTSVDQLAGIVTILAAANTVNVLMALPITIQFAHGIAKYVLRVNLAVGLLYLTSLALLVPGHGVQTAAVLWLLANIASFLILVLMTHRMGLLRGEAWAWFSQAILLPGCGAGLVLAACLSIRPGQSWLLLPWLAISWAIALTAALLCAPKPREFVGARLRQFLASVRT
jgi:O-antigen/teichoic acid export membrane protein